MTITRHDLADLAKSKRTATFTGRVGRSGPMTYRYADGDKIETRTPTELERVVDQLANLPVVITHPTTMLSQGDPAPRVGRVLKGWIDGDHAVAEILVEDADAIAKLDKAKTVEISLGYLIDGVNDAGEHVNTVLDHVALLPDMTSRCGDTCTLRTDCAPCEAKAIADAEQARADAEQDAKAKASHAAVQLAIAAGRGLVSDGKGHLVAGTPRADEQPRGAEALKAAEEANRKRLANAWRREDESK